MKKSLNILAIDLGYSSVKVCRRDAEGLIQFEKFNSATAQVEKPMEVNDEEIFQLGPNYYALGTAALKVGRSKLMRMNDWETLLIVTPVWVSYLIKRYEELDGRPVDVIAIGLSIAFKDKAQELIDRVATTLMLDPSKIVCLPQGVVCKVAYQKSGLNIIEESKKNDLKLQNFLIVDGGYLTIDISSVINGVASSSSTVGLVDTGVICISRDLIDFIYKNYGISITTNEAAVIVDNDGAWTRRGRKYDLSTQVKDISINYLKKVVKLLDDKFGENLDALSGMLIVGGLAEIFKKYYDDIIPFIESNLCGKNFIHFPDVYGEMYNAYGYFVIAEEKLS